MFFKGLLYGLVLLPLGILAALDDKSKLANRTIDRVSTCLLRIVPGMHPETPQERAELS